MGFLDSLFNKEVKEQRRLQKMEKTLTHMYVQPSERSYMISQLREMGNEDAARILLARFRENAHNTTVDLEEKEYVYEVLVELGRLPEIDMPKMVRNYITDPTVDARGKQFSINWPLKVLTDLMDRQEFVDFMTALLADLDTEYTRDPEKKQELILRARELEDEALSRQVVRFLDDQNETVRFHAVETLLAHGFDEIVEAPLRRRLVEEESLRITTKIVEAFASKKEWVIPEDEREEVERLLPSGYALHADGYVYKRRA